MATPAITRASTSQLTRALRWVVSEGGKSYTKPPIFYAALETNPMRENQTHQIGKRTLELISEHNAQSLSCPKPNLTNVGLNFETLKILQTKRVAVDPKITLSDFKEIVFVTGWECFPHMAMHGSPSSVKLTVASKNPNVITTDEELWQALSKEGITFHTAFVKKS